MIAGMESCQKKEEWKLFFSIRSFMMVITGKKIYKKEREREKRIRACVQNDHVADYARYHFIETEWVPQNVTQQLRGTRMHSFFNF